MKKITLLMLVLCLTALTVSAQPHTRPAPEGNPKIIAEIYTDMLEKELSLSQKQRKKIYKIVLKQTKKKQTDMAAHRPAGGMPSIGRSGSLGGMGMEPGGGGGGPRGGMGGGRGPGGGGGQKPPGNGKMSAQRLPSNATFNPEESEKDIEEREKQMKKILEPAQFSRWQELEQEKRENEKERKRIEEQVRLFPQYEKKTSE